MHFDYFFDDFDLRVFLGDLVIPCKCRGELDQLSCQSIDIDMNVDHLEKSFVNGQCIDGLADALDVEKDRKNMLLFESREDVLEVAAVVVDDVIKIEQCYDFE